MQSRFIVSVSWPVIRKRNSRLDVHGTPALSGTFRREFRNAVKFEASRFTEGTRNRPGFSPSKLSLVVDTMLEGNQRNKTERNSRKNWTRVYTVKVIKLRGVYSVCDMESLEYRWMINDPFSLGLMGLQFLWLEESPFKMTDRLLREYRA